MTLKAGAAVADIGPKRPMALYGYPHVERISTGVHDPISASALYLESGSEAAVIVSLDLLFLDPPTSRAIRASLAERIGVPQQRVFISCTHTHSAPVTTRLLAWGEDPAIPQPDGEYLEHVGIQAVSAACQARRQARPAELAWTTADATGAGGNRHGPEGATDPQVGILAVRGACGGSMIALSVIYSMHPTVLHENSTWISSDFPHYTRQHVRQQHGSDVVVLYQMAPSGNQSPRYFVRSQTFEEAERLGRKLAAAVNGSVQELLDTRFSDVPVISSDMCEVDLPRRAIPSVAEAERLLADCRAEYERLQAEGAERPEVRTAQCAIFGAEGTLALARAGEQGRVDEVLDRYRPIEVQVLRIGDAWLAGLPGELFVEYALEIKRLAPAKVFPVSLVNGDLQGYIVTPEAAAAGGYEAANTLFTPKAGEVLVSAVLAMVGRQHP